VGERLECLHLGDSVGTVLVKEMFVILLHRQKRILRREISRIDAGQSLCRCLRSILGFPRSGIGRSVGFGFGRLGLIGRLLRLHLLGVGVSEPVI
jgi:hypothetical protein